MAACSRLGSSLAVGRIQHPKGGLSRAYCAEDAPGELNLGFTAADDRETVLANRRLLAEAVTGDAATPLLALKQFHSNLVVDASAAYASRPAPRRADGLIISAIINATVGAVLLLLVLQLVRGGGRWSGGWASRWSWRR